MIFCLQINTTSVILIPAGHVKRRPVITHDAHAVFAMELELLKKIGLALALGMLVGTEREFSQRREGEPLFAGRRSRIVASIS